MDKFEKKESVEFLLRLLTSLHKNDCSCQALKMIQKRIEYLEKDQ